MLASRKIHYYDYTLIKKGKKMINLKVVKNALKRSWANELPLEYKDSLISVLIHDIFGGEILKTRKKHGWHFYNRIDGRRLDFTIPGKSSYGKINRFEDIPATPDETYDHMDQEDYSSFLIRFVRVFEEAVGLERYQTV
jgi:hypothetical protein